MQRIDYDLLNVSWTTRCSLRRKALVINGFTLVELMVVIAIIGILFSLIGVAVISMIGTARVAQTKATITKVQGLLQQRIDAALRRDPEKIFVDSLVPRFGNRNRALTMARKYEFRKAFPQSWNEIESYYPALLTGHTPGQTYPLAANRKDATQSGEVLYFLLTKANVLGYPPEGSDVFNATEVKDTDGNGVPEIVDAWGQPLRFYRWPTRLIRGGAWATGSTLPVGSFTPSPVARALMPALPTTYNDLTHDPDDKFGLLKVASDWSPPFPVSTTSLPTAEIAYFEQGGAPASSPFYKLGAFHTMDTTSMPLIVSGGADLSTGLYEPTDTSTTGGYLAQPNPSTLVACYDDVTNYNVRSGGN